LAKRQILVFRELTKINEELVIWSTTPGAIDPNVKELGEFTVVIGPAQPSQPVEPGNQVLVSRLYDLLSDSGLVQEENIASCVAAAFSIDSQAVAKAVKKGRILVKRQSEDG